MKTYSQWESEQKFSPVSPEAYHAERGWNAALAQIKAVVAGAMAAEGGDAARALVLIQTEIDGLMTEDTPK